MPAGRTSAGLLFIDPSTGDALQLTGYAHVDWTPQRACAFPGAERVVDFELRALVATADAQPPVGRLVEPANTSAEQDDSNGLRYAKSDLLHVRGAFSRSALCAGRREKALATGRGGQATRVQRRWIVWLATEASAGAFTLPRLRDERDLCRCVPRSPFLYRQLPA
jgi:hypothetical protein